MSNSASSLSNNKHNHCEVDDHSNNLNASYSLANSEQNRPVNNYTSTISHDFHSHSVLSKPKEFKFFKEKAKDKQQLFKNSTVNGALSSVSSKLQLPSSVAKVKFGSNGAFKKPPIKGTIISDDIPNGPTGKVTQRGSIFTDLGSKTSLQVDGLINNTNYNTVASVSPLVKEEDEIIREHIVDFCERVVDGFAFQCFFDLDSLEVSQA